jgi:hypothetical protein
VMLFGRNRFSTADESSLADSDRMHGAGKLIRS